MPLPAILIGGAVVAGLWGGKKMLDASSANSEAQSLGEEAADLFDRAKGELEGAREAANSALEDLGRLKIDVWQTDIKDFVRLMERIKDVELTGNVHIDDLAKTLVRPDQLGALKETSLRLAELGGAAVGSIASGALAGVAAYGGVGALATSSTGVAIGSLSGAAATNATLAWLGGGSLAAGGAGVAGGMAVLGGVIAGPALLVGGWAMSAKADANLAKARANLAEARQAAEDMALATTAVRGITRVSGQFEAAILQFQRTFRMTLGALQVVIAAAPVHRPPLLVRLLDALRGKRRGPSTSYKDYTPQQQQIVWLAYECASVMKRLLETPLLREDGAIDARCTDVLSLPRAVESKARRITA
ncbi:hypothetical protein [Azospirillum soli]|uniref:hypothetical protein n=1 Tax=Azospirillum soli TaxID=1304799 RepID=UPI001AE1C8C6|nr:hypothetical protein [Azospirillum soli]MBP2312929.1 hypothetical protein [Azospirillum soli]